MKKAVFIVMLVMCFSLMSACKTQPKAETEPAVELTETEQSYKEVYDRYRSRLILEGAGTYTVVAGDTLSQIARKLYHDGLDYPLIMLASSEVVLDPDKIEPGMELIVPDLQKNLDDDDARTALKEFFRAIADIEEPRGWHDTAVGLRNRADAL